MNNDKYRITGILGLILTLSAFGFCGTASAETIMFAGGDGSLENPYQIKNVDHLNAMRNNMSANYILTDEIDLSPYTVWDPIGTLQDPNNRNKSLPFTGTFDGNGYTISNLTYLPETVDPMEKQTDGNGSGLFGCIENATIKNVRIENIEIASTIMDHNNVGSLVGQADNSSIINCTSINGSIELTGILWLANAGNTGGLIGKAVNSTIEDCYSNISVKTHFHFAGGLIGSMTDTNVTNCSAAGDVSGRTVVGGLIGNSFIEGSDNVYISDSFSSGNATGTTVPSKNAPPLGGGITGGFIGLISQSSSSKSEPGQTYVSDCYATGNAVVNNGTTAGGFIGEYQNGIIANCYAIGDVYAEGNAYNNGTFSSGVAGGFAGRMKNGTIENCFVSNTVSTYSEAGGFIGQMTDGSIRKCYAVTNTTAVGSYAGGFIGHLCKGTVEESYAAGDVFSKHTAGGFIGFVNDTSKEYEIRISNTYSVCDVSTTQNKTGGFAGHVNATGSNVTIENSYAAGSIQATGNIGGLIGVSTKNVLSDSFFDNAATGTTATAGGSGGKGKNTDEMKNITVFENAGWNITSGEPEVSSVWYILEDYSYPLLTAFYPATVYIKNEEQLRMIGTRAYEYDADSSGQKKFWHTHADYVLIDDIVLSDSFFEPAGTESLPFKGNLTNQEDYVISNLKIEKSSEENIGFFRFAKKAVIDGIRFENASVSGDYSVGTFVGSGQNITLIDCAVISGNISAYQEAGGLIGKAGSSVLMNCTFIGDSVKAEGTYYAGGLIGNAENITVINSHAEVKEVYSENEYAGGLIGAVSGTKSSVYQSSFNGNVTSGYTYAGGLIGSAENISVSRSFAKGNVTADTHTAGGLVGALSNGIISEAFATTGTVTAYGIAGGLVGFANGSSIILTDTIATNSVHTEEGKAGGLVGVSASTALSLQNSFALNQYVNGTSDVGSLFGVSATGDVQGSNNFNWNGITNNGEFLNSQPELHGIGVTSEEVWDTFDESSVWDTFSVRSDWQKDEYRRYLLPILSWQMQPFIADALHLAPDEMQNRYYVTYTGNADNVTGVPIDSGNYILNDIVTVMSNETMANGNTPFIRWDTQSNGNGESFISGDTFEIKGDVILHAQWLSDEKENTNSKSHSSGRIKISPGMEISEEGFETEPTPDSIEFPAILSPVFFIFLTAIAFYLYRRGAEENEN